MDTPPTSKELEFAIAMPKQWKYPGIDGISNEVFKNLGTEALKKCWNTDASPPPNRKPIMVPY